MNAELFARVEALKVAAELSTFEGERSDLGAIIYNASVFEKFLLGEIGVRVVEEDSDKVVKQEDNVVTVDFSKKD